MLLVDHGYVSLRNSVATVVFPVAVMAYGVCSVALFSVYFTWLKCLVLNTKPYFAAHFNEIFTVIVFCCILITYSAIPL